MATRSRARPEDDGSSVGSFTLFSTTSQSGIVSREGGDTADESLFSEESRSSGTSMDSTERMLIQLEDSDESLTDLEVDCTSIDKKIAGHIAHFLPRNTRLETLRLHCGNNTPDHEEVLRRVLFGLRGNSSVQLIELRGAMVDRESARWLAPSFARSPTLNNIVMTNCSFVGSGLAILFVAMQHNHHIRHLTFRRCYLKGHNADLVASSLPLMNLRSLSLVDVNLTADDWPYLFRNLKACDGLMHLDLSRNRLNGGIINLLEKTLQVHASISNLSLECCDLDDDSLKELAKALRTANSKLSRVNISRNDRVTDDASVHLMDLLKINNSILELNLNGCSLNQLSLNAIENGLRYNNSFLKSFFSETTSKAIFGVVDSIERIDIGERTRHIVEVVSLECDSSPRRVLTANGGCRTMDGNCRAMPMPMDTWHDDISMGGDSSSGSWRGKKGRASKGGRRRKQR